MSDNNMTPELTLTADPVGTAAAAAPAAADDGPALHQPGMFIHGDLIEDASGIDYPEFGSSIHEDFLVREKNPKGAFEAAVGLDATAPAAAAADDGPALHQPGVWVHGELVEDAAEVEYPELGTSGRVYSDPIDDIIARFENGPAAVEATDPEGGDR